MDFFTSTAFWFALGSIILTNIVLSGDNAVVIALASRKLPPKQQKQAIFWGSAAAIIMRLVLTVAAVKLLTLPYLKMIGAVLLVYIGVQLLVEEGDDDESHDAKDNMWGAIKTILIADLVMSLDNVVAVAAAAQKGPEETRMLLLILGLGISIPLIIFGSTLLLKIMDRFPIIVVLGAALLGFLAGEMLVDDPSIKIGVDAMLPHAHTTAAIAGAVLVVLIGKLMQKRKQLQN